MGRLIPAGTGMKYYRQVELESDPSIYSAAEETVPQPAIDLGRGDE